MTNELARQLSNIQALLQQLLQDKTLTSQQQTFVKHMSQSADQLFALIEPVPAGLLALHEIIPTLPASFNQALPVLYGYARLLLDQPATFDRDALTPSQHTLLTQIYEHSLTFSQRIEKLKRDAFLSRVQQRQQSREQFNLNALLEQMIPVYRYWLRDASVRFTADLQAIPDVLSHPYHLNAIIRHIVVTIATELLEYGELHLSCSCNKSRAVVAIFATGLQGTSVEMDILFRIEGRHVYQQQMAKLGSEMKIDVTPGSGTTFYIYVPCVRS